MNKEIIINSNLRETRVAITEDQQLVEIFVEHSEDDRLLGAIYKGRIRKVLVSMQAAFVDIGLEEMDGFLPFSDIGPNALNYLNGEEILSPGGGVTRDRKGHEILKPGDDIVVQVVKEPIGNKGPRLTSQTSLPGRYLVLIPNSSEIMGVSRRITNYREKRRLKGILAKIKRPGYGLIARTVAQNKSQEQLEADLERLLDQWRDIESSFHKQQAPFQLHREKGMVSTMIRDMFADDVSQVVIDNKRIYKDVTRYLKEIQSPLVERIKLHKGKVPIFDHFNLETEIEKLTSSKVWLNGGGYLIIESTEAMVTIDVNSGSYNRKRKIEDNILKVNLIAVKEICQQIRLRDLGGLIIIDFIDMSDPANRKKVEEAMAREMSRDRAQWDLLPISKFGLMEMTRQRLRPELLYTLKEPCQVCNGTGMVPSMETMVTEIEQFIRRFRHQTREHRLELLVHKDLYDYLTAGRRSLIKTLMWKNFLRIKLLVDDALPVGRFAAVSPKQKKEITDEFST